MVSSELQSKVVCLFYAATFTVPPKSDAAKKKNAEAILDATSNLRCPLW